MIGDRFGRLVIVNELRPGRITCRCECGKSLEVQAHRVLKGHIKSCGCTRHLGSKDHNKTHGMAGTRTYRSWRAMRDRCYRPFETSYKNYGGRGITVCARWMKFENFLADMGERPANTTIDRIDNDGNYEPTNCRWATITEQNRNRSDSHRITIGTETKSLSEWAAQYEISADLVSLRIGRFGWNPIEALTTPSLGRGGAHRHQKHTPPEPPRAA